ncbi:hypothetical protein IT412_03190 [Candidatus Peregrinibacteria bacterium]|nr:hypothetical protein [Candidatus Peregrinibacteria bacterium]
MKKNLKKSAEKFAQKVAKESKKNLFYAEALAGVALVASAVFGSVMYFTHRGDKKNVKVEKPAFKKMKITVMKDIKQEGRRVKAVKLAKK